MLAVARRWAHEKEGQLLGTDPARPGPTNNGRGNAKGRTQWNACRILTPSRRANGSTRCAQFSTTKAVLDTIQAYWKEAAALEKLYYEDRTYRINAAVLTLTEELAKNGGVAQTEVPLAVAHRAEAFASRSAALIEVLNSAKALAATLGFLPADIEISLSGRVTSIPQTMISGRCPAISQTPRSECDSV